MEVFRCYSSAIAGHLRRQGFRIVGTEINKTKPQYDVFLFEDTEALRQAFDTYLTQRQEGKK